MTIIGRRARSRHWQGRVGWLVRGSREGKGRWGVRRACFEGCGIGPLGVAVVHVLSTPGLYAALRKCRSNCSSNIHTWKSHCCIIQRQNTLLEDYHSDPSIFSTSCPSIFPPAFPESSCLAPATPAPDPTLVPAPVAVSSPA